jgi:hypothetical protein
MASPTKWLEVRRGENVLLVSAPDSLKTIIKSEIRIQLPEAVWQENLPVYRSPDKDVKDFEDEPTTYDGYTGSRLLKIYLREIVRMLPKGIGVLTDEDLGIAVCPKGAKDTEWIDQKYWVLDFLCRWLEGQLQRGRDTRDQNAYYWFLRLRFLCVMEIFETSDDPKKKLVLPEYRRSFREWFNVCFYEDQPTIDNIYFFDWAGLDRECEIKALVFKRECLSSAESSGLWSGYELREFFKIRECSTKQPDGICTCQEPCLPPHQIKDRDLIAQRLLDRWFPRRYDLYSMLRLVTQYSPFQLSVHDLAWGLVCFLIASFMLSWFQSGWPPWRGTFSWTGLLESFFLAGALWSFSGRVLTHSHLIIPRLAAAIFVGYAPLLFSKDMWKTFQTMDWRPMFFLITVGMFGSLIYLRIELSKSLYGKWRIGGRVGFIWLVGIIEALIIGIIVSDVLGDWIGFSTEIADQTLRESWVFKGFFGHIYWKVTVLAGALALLLGVILQIIWEEKPITEPI